jgi:MFS transporter, OFA family, oxalate/formate antiporter
LVNQSVSDPVAASRSEFSLGWKVLFAASIGIAFGASPIPFNAIGHLVKPLQAEFGWSRAEIMTAVPVFAVAVSFLSPWFGSLIDRFGVRRIALGALLGFGLTWMLLTLTTSNILVFWLIWLVIGVVGGGSIPISWTRAVNSWFVKNRAFALAIALMGTGVGGIIINAGTPYLIESFGWRGAVIGLGLLSLLIALPIAFALFREPEPHERPAAAAIDPASLSGKTLGEAMREPRFWFMFMSFAMVALAFGGLFSNYVPLLIDKGFDPKMAGLVMTAIGVSTIVGRLLAGWLIDRYWAPLVAFPMLAAPAFACWELTHDVVALGFAAGAETDLIAFLAARYYGLKHYGKIYGTLYMPFGLATAFSALIYGAVFDHYGSYNLALWVAMGLFVVGAALLLFIGRYPDKIESKAQ